MKRLLFVDDEPKVLEGMQRMLRPKRKVWEMVFVESGIEAVKLLDSRPFEVIVTDVRMPQMDGIQLLEHVQARYPKMIRIVLSGYFEREAVLQAAGVAHQCLAKPCDADKLRQAIDSLCRSTSILCHEKARGLVSVIGALPPPPQTFASLERALQKPNACLEEVGQILGQDVGMTAKVLRLGLSAEIFQGFEPERPVPGFTLEGFQRQSRVAAEIAAGLPATGAVAAMGVIAALLHDVGSLVLAARLPEPFEAVLRTAREQGRPVYAVEEEVIGTSHAEVGACLLSLWGLPQPIVEAVWSHHRPSEARKTSEGLDVLALTHIASALAAETEEGVPLDAPPAACFWDFEYLKSLGVAGEIPGWRKRAAELAAFIGRTTL